MTLEQLVKHFEGKTRHIAAVDYEDFRELFPGPQLSRVEREFKTELFKAGGAHYNPRGSSQDDQIMKFCHENHISFRLGNKRVMFFCGGVPPPEIVRLFEDGTIPSFKGEEGG